MKRARVLLSSRYLPTYIGKNVFRGPVFKHKYENGIAVPYFFTGTEVHPINVYLLVRGEKLNEKYDWVAIAYAPIYLVGSYRKIAWDVGLKNYKRALRRLKL